MDSVVSVKFESLSLSETGKKLLGNVILFIQKANTGYSRIQVKHFILNDVEHPTSYAKFKQAKLELYNRYLRLVDFYFEIRKKTVELEVKKRELANIHDDLEKELKFLEIQELEFAIKVL